MQKFLWITALFIALFGFYFAYERNYPEKCTQRAMKKYVMQETGGMTMIQQQNPAIIRSLQIQYIRNNKCNAKMTEDRPR